MTFSHLSLKKKSCIQCTINKHSKYCDVFGIRPLPLLKYMTSRLDFLVFVFVYIHRALCKRALYQNKQTFQKKQSFITCVCKNIFRIKFKIRKNNFLKHAKVVHHWSHPVPPPHNAWKLMPFWPCPLIFQAASSKRPSSASAGEKWAGEACIPEASAGDVGRSSVAKEEEHKTDCHALVRAG